MFRLTEMKVAKVQIIKNESSQLCKILLCKLVDENLVQIPEIQNLKELE